MKASRGKPRAGWTFPNPKYRCVHCGWGYADLKAFLRHKSRCAKKDVQP
jgi:hypothetical protein